jgi:heparan-alpha-glucosaminide N-acetyltransferase
LVYFYRIIDIAIFGRKHIYTHPSAKPIYDTTEPYDPEGSLGSLTSVFIVFLGVQCGYTLLTFNDWKPRVKRWLSWAVVLGSIAGALCGFSKNDGIIPINKNLWSLSFVIGMAAMAFFLLTIM